MQPKYPEITVKLIGNDGNAFVILAAVRKAMTKHKVSHEEIKKYLDDAMSGDYNNLLKVTMDWVNVE